MKRIFIMVHIVISCSYLFSCINVRGTYATLKEQGYEDIRITGYRSVDCGGCGSVHTGFTATKDGQSITGTVCESIFFKGRTIKHD